METREIERIYDDYRRFNREMMSDMAAEGNRLSPEAAAEEMSLREFSDWWNSLSAENQERYRTRYRDGFRASVEKSAENICQVLTEMSQPTPAN